MITSVRNQDHGHINAKGLINLKVNTQFGCQQMDWYTRELRLTGKLGYKEMFLL